LRGGRHEEAGENESIEGRSEEEEREKLLEKVERGEEISHVSLRFQVSGFKCQVLELATRNLHPAVFRSNSETTGRSLPGAE
jgi:hypothetical protein